MFGVNVTLKSLYFDCFKLIGFRFMKNSLVMLAQKPLGDIAFIHIQKQNYVLIRLRLNTFWWYVTGEHIIFVCECLRGI